MRETCVCRENGCGYIVCDLFIWLLFWSYRECGTDLWTLKNTYTLINILSQKWDIKCRKLWIMLNKTANKKKLNTSIICRWYIYVTNFRNKIFKNEIYVSLNKLYEFSQLEWENKYKKIYKRNYGKKLYFGIIIMFKNEIYITIM